MRTGRSVDAGVLVLVSLWCLTRQSRDVDDRGGGNDREPRRWGWTRARTSKEPETQNKMRGSEKTVAVQWAYELSHGWELHTELRGNMRPCCLLYFSLAFDKVIPGYLYAKLQWVFYT